MGKSVPSQYVPYVISPKLEPHELGSHSKSLEAAMKMLETLTRGAKVERDSNGAAAMYGALSNAKPPGLLQGELQLNHECSNSYPTLEDIGKTSLLPDFDGSSSRRFVSWLYEVECYFKDKCFSDTMKCELVVSCLKSGALLWYNTLNFSRRMKWKGRINSCIELDSYMRMKFLPCSTMNNLENEFKNLKMDSLCVKDYAMNFNELYFICGNPTNSSEKIILFYNGLNLEIQNWVNIEQVSSFELLCELALCVEKRIANTSKNKNLLFKNNLRCVETVLDGSDKGQVLEEPCIDAMVKNNVCVKPEILTHLVESVCDEMNHVSDACIVRCLNPMKNEPLIIDHEWDEESPALTFSKPLKLSNTCLAPTHCENKDQIPNLSPNESTSNHLLFECQAQKNNQSISHVTAEIHWESSKGEATGGSCFVSCPRIQNMNFCTSYCPGFTTSYLGGIMCVLSTPHFHFYMLMRLKISLVHSSAISYLIKVNNGDISCDMYKLPGTEDVNCFREFNDLNSLYYMLLELLWKNSSSKKFILLTSTWKLIINGEMEQFRNFFLVLKLLNFEMNILQVHCKNLLGMLRISSGGSLHDLEGVLAFMVMFVLKVMHENISSPFIALLCSTGCINSNYGLSLGAYILLDIQCDIIVVRLGVEPPWSFGEGYMDSIEKKTGMSINRGNESAHASGLNVQFSILVVELLSAAPMSLRQAILVFDPGGRYVISVHEYNCSFDQARCKEIFFLHSEFEVKFF